MTIAPSTAWFARDGVRIAYDELGDRDAPAIVLLHAGSDDRHAWDRVSETLVKRFHMVRVDLRGHGESDRTPGSYTIPDVGDDVAALCDELDLAPAVLVGHSLGAVTVAYLAAARPDLAAGAFLEDPPMFIFEPEAWEASVFSKLFPVLQAGIRDAQATDDPEATLRQLMAAMPSARGDGTMADALGPKGTARQARAWARFDTAVLDIALDLTAWGDHDPDSPIECPVTVVRADPSLGPAFFPEHEARFRRAAPKAEFVVAEGFTHVIHPVDPAWFTAQLHTFLSRVSDVSQQREATAAVEQTREMRTEAHR